MPISSVYGSNAAQFVAGTKQMNSSITEIIANRSATSTASSPMQGHLINRQDFTSMTPNDMKDAAQNLYDAGKIDLTQLLMLKTAGVPIGKMGPNGELISLSAAEKANHGRTSQNYIKISKEALSFLEQSGRATDPQSDYKNWQSILVTLQNNQEAAAGLDIMA